MNYMINNFKYKKAGFIYFLFSSFFLLEAYGQDYELKTSMESGKKLYDLKCVSCHMDTGKGIVGAFPPLAKSDYLMQDVGRAAKIIISGVSGKMIVNGTAYYGAMPGYEMTNKEVSDVLNYITNSWGNKGEIVNEKTIESIR